MAKLKIDTTYLYAARLLGDVELRRFILAVIDIAEGVPPNIEGIEATIAPIAAVIQSERERDKAISVVRADAARVRYKDKPTKTDQQPAPEEIDLGVYADELRRWFAYRRERHLSTYKPTALKTLLNKIERECRGDTAILRAAIDESVAANYQGLFFKRNNKQQQQNKLSKDLPKNYADF